MKKKHSQTRKRQQEKLQQIKTTGQKEQKDQKKRRNSANRGRQAGKSREQRFDQKAGREQSSPQRTSQLKPGQKTAQRERSNATRVPHKVPEALPLKSEQARTNPLTRLTGRIFKKPAIQEVVREPTAGGIIFRESADRRDIEILLIQDSKGRWTIPKGHIEPGETAKQTAIREIGEESGLFHIQVLTWLGKIQFQYRRADKLVLMTTQIYLVRALDDAETPTKEQWMKGIKWFSFNDAIDAIEYDDIEKLMLLAKNKIRQGI